MYLYRMDYKKKYLKYKNKYLKLKDLLGGTKKKKKSKNPKQPKSSEEIKKKKSENPKQHKSSEEVKKDRIESFKKYITILQGRLPNSVSNISNIRFLDKIDISKLKFTNHALDRVETRVPEKDINIIKGELKNPKILKSEFQVLNNNSGRYVETCIYFTSNYTLILNKEKTRVITFWQNDPTKSEFDKWYEKKKNKALLKAKEKLETKRNSDIEIKNNFLEKQNESFRNYVIIIKSKLPSEYYNFNNDEIIDTFNTTEMKFSEDALNEIDKKDKKNIENIIKSELDNSQILKYKFDTTKIKDNIYQQKIIITNNHTLFLENKDSKLNIVRIIQNNFKNQSVSFEEYLNLNNGLKESWLENANEKLNNRVRGEVNPFNPEEQLQKRIQIKQRRLAKRKKKSQQKKKANRTKTK